MLPPIKQQPQSPNVCFNKENHPIYIYSIFNLIGCFHHSFFSQALFIALSESLSLTSLGVSESMSQRLLVPSLWTTLAYLVVVVQAAKKKASILVYAL